MRLRRLLTPLLSSALVVGGGLPVMVSPAAAAQPTAAALTAGCDASVDSSTVGAAIPGLLPVSDAEVLAQVFTIQQSGLLSRVLVPLSHNSWGDAPADVTASLYAVGANGPTGSPLATQRVAAMPVPSTGTATQPIVFDDPIDVMTGQTYAVALTSSSSRVYWPLATVKRGGVWAKGSSGEWLLEPAGSSKASSTLQVEPYVQQSSTLTLVQATAPAPATACPPALQAAGSVGAPLAPITIGSTGFTPDTVAVTDGQALPQGLSLAAGATAGTWVVSGTPTRAGTASVLVEGRSGSQVRYASLTFRIVSDDPCVTSPPDGTGSAGDPLLVATAADLRYLRDNRSLWSRHVRQVADIDLSGCTWRSGIGDALTAFTGTYDGRGFAIANLTMTATGPFAGLFSTVGGKDGSVRSTHLVDAAVSGSSFGGLVGGLVGRLSGRAEVKASSVTGAVRGGGVVGGLVGSFQSTGVIINSVSEATVATLVAGTRAVAVGGLVGQAFTGTRIINSYAIGQVEGSSNLGPVAGRSGGEATSVLWNPTDSGVPSNGVGLQRTQDQMRDWLTYSSAGWRIADGFTRAQPWSICSGFNGGYPFLSQRHLVDPCPSLTASTSAVVARAGVEIAPVTFTAERFTPTSFAVTAGTLPTGVSIDVSTGRITGTPLAKSGKVSVEVTATQGRARLSAVVDFTVQGQQVEGKGCEVSGPGVTITCKDPGTYAIDAPEGYELVDYALLGADGGRVGGDPFGLGASVERGAVSVDGAGRSWVVTVGSAGKGPKLGPVFGGGAVTGGGYSSLQIAGADGDPASLIAAAGGGGGNWESGLTRLLACIVPTGSKASCADAAPLTEAQRAALVSLLSTGSLLSAGNASSQPTNAWTAADMQVARDYVSAIQKQYVPSAGAPSSVSQPRPNWAAMAAGSSGATLAIASMQLPFFSYAGASGKTFASVGATVATRPSAASPRPGRVRLQFAPIGATVVDTAQCDSAAPALGELVSCDQPGRASVTVPDGAKIAITTVNGAGGGGGRTTISSAGSGQPLAGGPGASVDAVVDVAGTQRLGATVGSAGAATWFTPNWTSFTWYGSGGGASSLEAADGTVLVSAGGGGGANGFDADYSQVPAASRSASQAYVAGYVRAASVTAPAGATTWPVPAMAVGEGANGGVQGQSWWAGSRVASATFSADGRPGGTVGLDASGLPAEKPLAAGGLVTMTFCGVPESPTVTSVEPGTSSGLATADVTAAKSGNRGCAIDGYEFRLQGADAWVPAPGLSFPITYLESAQSVCVQMRARNAAGWGDASRFTCGTARNAVADADVQAGGESSMAAITVATGGGISPTTIFVNVGDSFVVRNYGTVANQAYLRPANPGAATVTKAGTTCVGDGNLTAANCFLNPSTDSGVTPGETVFTVVSRGNVLIYTGSSNGMQTATIAIS